MVASNTRVKFCCFVGVSLGFVGVNLGLNSCPYLESSPYLESYLEIYSHLFNLIWLSS